MEPFSLFVSVFSVLLNVILLESRRMNKPSTQGDITITPSGVDGLLFILQLFQLTSSTLPYRTAYTSRIIIDD